LTNQVLGVVSAKGGEGRTTVALALAAALSEMHHRVIYVECDSSDSSTLLGQMGEPQVEGLSEWLGGDSNLNAAIYETGSGQLFVLPYGNAAVRSTPLETVSRMRILFDRLRGMFDVVVVDMPAVLTNEGTPALIKELDNILLVVGANQTTSGEVEETVRLCGYIPVTGIFLNKLTYSAPEWVMSLVSPGMGRVAS
jgi:Mrp family chromosome partitioning ATPase